MISLGLVETGMGGARIIVSLTEIPVTFDPPPKGVYRSQPTFYFRASNGVMVRSSYANAVAPSGIYISNYAPQAQKSGHRQYATVAGAKRVFNKLKKALEEFMQTDEYKKLFVSHVSEVKREEMFKPWS